MQAGAGRATPDGMTSMTVNGEAVRYRLDPETPLLWALRDASNLTGTKYGCDSQDCGACTVIVDGRAAFACQLDIGSLEGADVQTVEGLPGGRRHPVVRAWEAAQVSQCGQCEPGFIMALAALLKATPNPGAADLAAIPNLCRCGIIPRLEEAIRMAGRAVGPPAPATPAPPVQPVDSKDGAAST